MLGVRDIVVSMRQIGSSHKTAGRRACKIREGNRVSPGVGLIDESKRKCVRFGVGGELSPKEALQEEKLKLITELAKLYTNLTKDVRKQSHKTA